MGESGLLTASEEFEVGEEFAGGVVAFIAVFGHHHFDHGGSAGGEGGVDVVRGYKRLLEVLVHDGGGGGRLEGDAAGDHVVEGCAEGVDVGAVVDVDLSANLLGADVVGCSVGAAGLGHGGFEVGHFAGETHVGELGDMLAGEHDIFGLDVAVDEAAFVGVVEGFGDLGDDFEGFFFGEGLSGGEFVVDGAAFDELHDEVVEAAGLTDVNGLDDVVVVELSGGASLAVEAVDEFAVFGHTSREDLDGDDAIEAKLAGAIDGCHCARADLIENLVAGDLLGGAGGAGVIVGADDEPAELRACEVAQFDE